MSQQIRTKKCYLYADVQRNRYCVYSNEGMDETFPDQYILVGSADVDFDVDLSDDEITAKHIEGLKEKITKIRAEAQREISVVDERIQSLLAIGHDTVQP